MLRTAGLVAIFLATACRSETLPETMVGDVERGFELALELGCVHCHASEIAGEPAPRLERVGARLQPAAITAALAAGPRMPDCLAPLDSDERAAARGELTHFLASLGGPLERAQQDFDALTIERGRQLYHLVGCVACHEPFEEPATLARPLWDFPEAFERAPVAALPSGAAEPDRTPRDSRDLHGIAARTSPKALAAYLVDPLAVHPGGRMPSLALSAGEAADLAAYLFYEDAVDTGAVLTHGPGLLLDVYEANFEGETAAFDALTPVRTEVAHSFFEGLVHRADDFGLRFRGLLEVKEPGTYEFATKSDDGSMLSLDGKLVVDNRGQHGMDEKRAALHLAAGRHAFELTYFEHYGDEGLDVTWLGPGFAARALDFEPLSHLEVRIEAPASEPFALEPELVERGRERYDALGCASCHTRCGEKEKPFAELDPRHGCLAKEPEGRAPHYALSPEQRRSLIGAVLARVPRPLEPAARLADTLARLECGACHERGTLAGPSDARRGYFQVESGLDLGDQGRFPPSLERVGAKLKPAWFETVLNGGGRARPYMKTRMPQFGAANVGELPALFAAADAALRDEREGEFSLEAVEAGKLLAGTKGLGCIQCHEFAGHPSIGIPAVDLAKVHERIYPGWFRELLMDPIALQMNTRMPTFWTNGKSPVALFDHDPARQVDALWTYISLGSSMPLPEGLVPAEGEYEVEVYDEPVCVGVFMEGVSPRTVCVGLPERVHYAFDVQHSRLAKAWRGRFLNARGTWYARAGQLEKPAGEDVLEFPRGPAFAVLADGEAPWPDAPGGCRPLGRGFDELRRPTFRYALGTLEVSETTSARLQSGGAELARAFQFKRYEYQGDVFMRVATGGSIRQQEPHTWRVDGPQPFVVRDVPETAFVTGGNGRPAELRFPLGFGVADYSPAHGTSGQRGTVGFGRVEILYSW